MGGTLSQRVGFWAGLALAVALQFVPVPEGLSAEAWLLASLGVLMACWWATEALPIAATALIPIALFPLFGISSVRATTVEYAHPIVMLLLGGFIIALAIERWNLHTRIALNVVKSVGGKPAALVGGFMLASALLSMWISNTATTLMMIPIALRVAQEVEREGVASPIFATALVLGVAYAASIGGMATPVGTPTNLIGIGYMENEFGRVIDFPEWMALGVPAAALIVPAAWLILTKWVFPLDAKAESEAARQLVREELKGLGVMKAPEVRVALLFVTVAILWMGRELPAFWADDPEAQFGWNPMLEALSKFLWPGEVVPGQIERDRTGLLTLSLGNTQIAMMGALAAFLIPAGGKTGEGRMLMDWQGVARLPWNVLILFGGGLSLAAALSSTGLADWLGNQMNFVSAWPAPLLLLALVAVVVFLTELTSNVATTTAFMPVLGVIAVNAGVPPETLIVPIAIAASTAFMLPVATAPNAIVYASGATTQGQMIKAGFRINLVSILIITGVGYVAIQLGFGG